MKFVKKLTALFLAIVMTMAMGITAFADDVVEDDGKVTITIESPVAGHTYKVYQLLTGDVSGTKQNSGDNGGTEGTLSNVEKGSSLNSTYAADGKTADDVLNALRVDGDSTKAFKTGADLGDAAYALIDTTKDVDTLSSSRTTLKVAPGYYVIVDTEYTGTDTTGIVYSRNMVTVAADTKVTPKTSTTDINKNIVDTDANKAFEATTDTNGKLTNNGGKTDTAAIGDVIEYQIDGTVPNTAGYKYYYYVVNDTFSEGLTLNAKVNETDTTNTGIVVKIQKANRAENGSVTYDDAVTLTENEDYVVLTGESASPKTFQIAFKDMKALEATYNAGAKITINYSATVNDKAVVGQNPNTNTANLTYSNNPNDSQQYDKNSYVPGEDHPQGETVNKVTKTYVTELDLFKVDENGQTLTGAEFTLTGTNLNKVVITVADQFTKDDEKGTYYKLKATDPNGNHTYTTEAPTENVYENDELKTKSNYEDYADATSSDNGDTVTCTKKYTKTTKTEVKTKDTTSSSVKATVGADGKVTFTGLNVGSYTLSETGTPAGYNTIDNIEFTIGANSTASQNTSEGGSITWTITQEDETHKVTTDDKTFKVTVENKKGSILPSTGGMGTTVIYVAGIAMIVVAGIVVIARKRMA